MLLSRAHNYPRTHKALTILSASLAVFAFIGTLLRNAVLTNVFFCFGGIAVFWGIFIQMVPAMFALYHRRKARPTSEQLAVAMAGMSDQQLLDMFPTVFDMSDQQQREFFPGALAMFPHGFHRCLEALDAARLELHKRNVPVPLVEFQPLLFMQLKESRDLRRVFGWCILAALIAVPMSFRVMRHPVRTMVRGEHSVTYDLAAIFIQIATPIIAGTAALALVVIPCILLVQYRIHRKRQRRLAALAAAIAESSRDLVGARN